MIYPNISAATAFTGPMSIAAETAESPSEAFGCGWTTDFEQLQLLLAQSL